MTARKLQAPEVLDNESGQALFDEVAADGYDAETEFVLDLSATERMDTLGGAWLMEIATYLQEHDSQIRWEGAQGHVAEFLDLIEPGLKSKPPAPEPTPGFLARVGARALHIFGEARQLGGLIVDAIYWTFLAFWDGRGFRWGILLDELHEMGVRAIGINFLMNFLLGLIVTMLSAAQLEAFGGSIYVADLLVIAFARELGVIMTATVVSARTGAAIAAELATMKVQEEIDALRGMGLNTSQFLVAPKVVALLICMPALVTLGIIAGVSGGSLWALTVMEMDYEAWTRQLLNAADLSDFFQGYLKAIIFAIVIVLIGCHNGLRVTGGSRGVGLMTTRAVVWDIFAIITIDMIFAAFFDVTL